MVCGAMDGVGCPVWGDGCARGGGLERTEVGFFGRLVIRDGHGDLSCLNKSGGVDPFIAVVKPAPLPFSVDIIRDLQRHGGDKDRWPERSSMSGK